LSIIDDRATADQRAALVALDSAKHGGHYFEIFASLPSPSRTDLRLTGNRD
jgi:hypothetical protein